MISPNIHSTHIKPIILGKPSLVGVSILADLAHPNSVECHRQNHCNDTRTQFYLPLRPFINLCFVKSYFWQIVDTHALKNMQLDSTMILQLHITWFFWQQKSANERNNHR